MPHQNVVIVEENIVLFFGGCEVMKRKVEAQKLRTKERISYADAIRKIVHDIRPGEIQEAKSRTESDTEHKEGKK